MTISDLLLLKALRATEQAAIAAFKLCGKGDEKTADQYAVDAMRQELNKIDMKGRIVIGEGERDKAPMLYIGEEVGTQKGIEVDIAVDPLEGTTILANAGAGALSVMAMTNKGGFLHAPDVYMDKIAIGLDFKEALISLDNSIAENLTNLSLAKKCEISELDVVILKRDRHEELIAKLREAGVRVNLIDDGDVAAVISTTMSKADMYIGIGGAPEGVLAAAALQALGGQICGRLLFKNKAEEDRAKLMGIKDLNKEYRIEEMAQGDIIFSATGVTNGALLKGVQYTKKNIFVSSFITSSCNKLSHNIQTKYSL
jgi:fructose-1,6-bisphosphatase class II